jgi:hypothetical protein
VALREQADEDALEHRVLPAITRPDLEERLLEALLASTGEDICCSLTLPP